MSNRVSIEATKFVNKDGSETYGFRMYDDYAQMYYNCSESNVMELEDFDLLGHVLERSDDVTGEMFTFCMEENKGIYINDTWYDYDELKDILEKHYA